MEFLAKTHVRIALTVVGTAAVAAGSYLIGKQHGVAATMVQADQYVREVLASHITIKNDSTSTAE